MMYAHVTELLSGMLVEMEYMINFVLFSASCMAIEKIKSVKEKSFSFG